MNKSLLFCAVTCAHYAGRTTRGELERKNDGNIRWRGCPEKAGAMGAQELTLHPNPSKIQRYKENVRKESKIREIFSRNCSSLLWQNHHILRRHVRPLRREHKARRVGIKMLLIYAFIIRIYSQLQHQLHKQLDVTRHKSTFRIYVTTNHKASV